MLFQPQNRVNVVDDLIGLKDTGKRAVSPLQIRELYFNKTVLGMVVMKTNRKTFQLANIS